ncbi:MAG: KpsF/GutQ family sugar-phosphate isomerase [Verrucomicrobia bacterium]|nr:KpsF/GutQ family sugar-phosphate isomerase [Verrucomicrobiota bacterium]
MNKTTPETEADWLAVAQAAMRCEAECLQAAADRLDRRLVRAVEIILLNPGKVVVSGLGKSGLIGQKIAATLCSTGTPAVFLHPADALHGDLGVYAPGDPTLLVSNSGATAELLRLIPLLRQFQSPLIGILGNVKSPMATRVDLVLDATVAREADPANIAPTSSAVVAMALGDALASALIRARNFTLDDYARYHPAGQLGRNLLLTVRDVMHRDAAVAWVRSDDPMKQIVLAMTSHPLGAACVVTHDGKLEGLITEGDLRRALQTHDDIRPLKARDIMTAKPTTVAADACLRDALHLMENRPSQISVLPVADAGGHCLGLIRIHDIYHGSSDAPARPRGDALP